MKVAGKPKVAVVDLFCGAGGLTHGLKKEGFAVKAGFDIDPQCKFAYEENNGAVYLEKDISEVTGREVSKFFDGADYSLLAGCAPCQPFSKYTQGQSLEGNEKWSLLNQFARLVGETLPDFVTMENVPQLARHEILDEFCEFLGEQGYQISKTVVKCADYGVPQGRDRLVLLASRFHQVPLQLVSKSRYSKKTVEDAIGHLAPLGAGGIDPDDSLHRASRLSHLNLQRIKVSKAGGTWRDWPESLRASCHKSKSGQSYVSVYGRMRWDEPAPTMTTQCYGFGNGRFGHPEQDRAISLREAAILQSFPDDYKFEPANSDYGMRSVGRMIGNAVPVKLGVIIARSFQNHIKSLHS